MLEQLRKDLRNSADPQKARLLQRFFKTGPGEYGHGDIFLGIVVPKQRKIASTYADLPLNNCRKLLHSKIHEERMAALLILVDRFKRADEKEREAIYRFYLANTRWINNWDLVDLSAHRIVGAYLLDKPKTVLASLARSKNLWERRIAIVATFAEINRGKPQYSLKIARILLHDRHDLIHKAVGWMLREVGKRCSQQAEESFLRKYCRRMPRTMLRYAIERFPKPLQKVYLAR